MKIMAADRQNLFLLTIDPEGCRCQHLPFGKGMIARMRPFAMTHAIAAPDSRGQGATTDGAQHGVMIDDPVSSMGTDCSPSPARHSATVSHRQPPIRAPF